MFLKSLLDLIVDPKQKLYHMLIRAFTWPMISHNWVHHGSPVLISFVNYEGFPVNNVLDIWDVKEIKSVIVCSLEVLMMCNEYFKSCGKIKVHSKVKSQDFLFSHVINASFNQFIFEQIVLLLFRFRVQTINYPTEPHIIFFNIAFFSPTLILLDLFNTFHYFWQLLLGFLWFNFLRLFRLRIIFFLWVTVLSLGWYFSLYVWLENFIRKIIKLFNLFFSCFTNALGCLNRKLVGI